MIQLLYGLPGTGKSTAMHDLVRAQADHHRFFVVDHEEGWGRGARYWRGNPPPNLFVFEARSNPPIYESAPDAGVFVFRNWEPLRVARMVVEWGNTVFVDDEIDFAARREGWEVNPLRLIVHQGRHLPNARGTISEAHIIGACRRPQNLAADLSELASEVFVFRCQGDLTLKRLLRDGHIEADEIETVRTLPNFEFLHFPTRRRLAARAL